MKAVNQAQLKIVQEEIQANQQKIAALEAKQVELQQILDRCQLHKELIVERAIPDYTYWLPVSR